MKSKVYLTLTPFFPMKYSRLFLGFLAVCLLGGTSVPVTHLHAETDASQETTSSFEVYGQLIELSSTTTPTTIVVRKNPGGEFKDYTVDLVPGTRFGTWSGNETSMDDWIPGDSLHIIGTKNENTGVITATVAVNTSLNPRSNKGLNGWITSIDTKASTMTVQWGGKDYVVSVTSDTRMVVPPKNPATLSDFKVNDRVRLRLSNEGSGNTALIIVALRRGDEIFLKARTRAFTAVLNDIHSESLEVTLLANPHLQRGDVNNLVGVEGDQEKVLLDEHTTFVRRYNGVTTVDELVEGDLLYIVGRVNDDGTITARLIKDQNIWRKEVATHVGEVLSIDTKTNTIVVNPIEKNHDSSTVDRLTISYTNTTTFYADEKQVDETAVKIGDVIRVRGTAALRGEVLSIAEAVSVSIRTHRFDDDHDADHDEADDDSNNDDADDEADDDNDHDEADDEDNDDLPDLTVRSVTHAPYLTATVANLGQSDVKKPVGIYFWFDGDLKWTYSSSTLSDQSFLKEGRSSAISPQLLKQDTRVKVCVDPNNVVKESDETNNCLTVTIDV